MGRFDQSRVLSSPANQWDLLETFLPFPFRLLISIPLHRKWLSNRRSSPTNQYFTQEYIKVGLRFSVISTKEIFFRVDQN